ncbi:NAD(P)-dependent dehydrogenase (short-subunit alcohol dehydrogenase family) [Panacagrimonas perspica]|uniref:NAD(P)-dependent dehydrogenase (Short-subunit alcohol dehydrogenase family) n=1 Tax=Panacagrimonas perspica TaxID=381431 RepID=A0A4S3K412_9GAMM|nr:SDR family NAD(P)-dependent oxidoreductase [Panacagrimonas perspica]TDU25832.1 NAD(P)-dependent dehydrogenase (short-subunit alcohol dehydrogenase family) [Panacagrimonas perspica]THD02800.1 2-hydroxycyclohexanecarboxyl-CoA dehydrogenase [Panacagrimonas perspica]
MELENKIIALTGGASGIGRATALLLASQGATVCIGELDVAGAERTAADGTGAGSLHAYPLDLADAASVKTYADTIMKTHGRVDGLVNAAGFDKIGPFMKNDPALWDRLVAVNLLGAIRLTQLVLPSMIEAKAGKIVNIASDAGRVGSMGETVYAATKGGLIAFTKSLAREMARYQINVNCVCPGPTDTPLFNTQVEGNLREALMNAIPFRRLAQPEDIANAIAFMMSPRSSYVTGQVLSVSGGLTMVG